MMDSAFNKNKGFDTLVQRKKWHFNVIRGLTCPEDTRSKLSAADSLFVSCVIRVSFMFGTMFNSHTVLFK